MHIGKSYRLTEFLHWTRRKIYVLTLVTTVPVVLYQLLDLKWVALPWVVVAVLGIATSFIVWKHSRSGQPSPPAAVTGA